MKQAPAPKALRALFSVVFAGFFASTLAAVWFELEHLAHALLHPFHCGTQPSALAVGGAAIGSLGFLGILWKFSQGAQAPFLASGAILLGFVLAVASMQVEPQQRSWQGAGALAIKVGKGLFEQANTTLQTQGRVDRTQGTWSAWLGKVTGGEKSAFRARPFDALDYRVELLSSEGAIPDPLVPGTLGVWVSSDGAVFSLWIVGLNAQGVPERLKDTEGNILRFKGAYHPPDENL